MLCAHFPPPQASGPHVPVVAQPYTVTRSRNTDLPRRISLATTEHNNTAPQGMASARRAERVKAESKPMTPPP